MDGHIVVGVTPRQPAAVVATAATFAETFGAHLVCASVDASHYPVEVAPDGTVFALPIDPDVDDAADETFDPQLREEIASILVPRPVTWSVRALAGGPAVELARLAAELDAAMIVVGTRERGIKGSVREFLGGSVAAQLAHRQPRPVVVVPLAPVGPDEDLPWRAGS